MTGEPGSICNGCGQPFQDGELVALAVYPHKFHTFLPPHYDLNENRECTSIAVLSQGKTIIIRNKGVFYKGNIYELEALNECQKDGELRVELVEGLRGLRIVGKLERLARMEPISDFTTRPADTTPGITR